MPFPRTWSEELIAEWLQLKGFFVEVGVPISSGRRGGRNEADVVGVSVKGDMVKIMHIEVGSLSGNPVDNCEMMEQKFSVQNQKDVVRYCRNKLEFAPNQQIDYEKLYIAVWASDKTMSYLEQQQLPVRRLSEFIKNEIEPTIQQWKNNPPHKPQTKGSITLPEGMWLLYLTDYLLH